MNPLKRFCLLLVAACIAAFIYWSLVSSRQPETSSSNDSPLQADVHPAAEIASPLDADGSSPSDCASPSDKAAPDRQKLDAVSFEAARTAALLSRTPKGIWSDRSPALEDYVADISVAHATALADFRALFPDLDPTDVQDFAEATMRQRATYGDTLDEDEAARFTAWLEPMERMQQAAVVARANLVGVVLNGSEPIDLDTGTRSFSLIGFEGAMPCYSFTQNAAAAESTGVNLVRLSSSYDPQISPPADGTGLYVNVNDGGTIYEHAEFQLPNGGGSRIIYKEINDAGSRDHMTHVAGTVGACGYSANLMGMAPRVWIRSHIQQTPSDITGYGMLWPGQKHSATNPTNGETEMKSVMGTTSLGQNYTGPYSSTSASLDTILRDYPYYIHFYSAGNAGSNYNTVSADQQMSKNVVTMGAVNDTVRDDSGAYVSGGGNYTASSRGPTFDGRIKPDLTANGVGLTSPSSLTGSSSMSGTSMATPNASGSTTLLIDYINRKLPGHFLRSSTLRALLMNTADDRGNAGPDYIYGFGIINVKAAADIVKRYAENPSTRVLLEDTLSASQTWTRTYTYDGDGPIRLTLAWIDPAGAGQSSSTTNRSPRLVNNLNVRLIGPDNTTQQPFVMPFTIGNDTYPAYDANLYGAAAVTGDNFTDPHEQILVANPPAGTYTVQVTHSGSLQNNNAQPFSIAITGLSGTTPVAPALASISPTTGNATNNFILTCDGSDFVIGSDVFLRRAAANGTTEEVKGYGIIPVSNSIIARFDTATLTKGYWGVVVRAPDGTESILKDAFLLPNSSGSGATLYPPRITSTAITTANQSEAYSYSVTTTDPDTAGASLVFAATGLPAGLTLTPNGSGGATLSGTPTVIGVFPVSISVSDSAYTTYQNFSLVVFSPGGNKAPVVSAGPDQTVTLQAGEVLTPGWSHAAWTGDADSGIDSANNYTAKHCFGANNAGSVTVNGVTFPESFATFGTGWSVIGTVKNWTGNDDASISGNSEKLAQEFIYDGNPRTVTFSGLTPGQSYEANFYSVGFEAGDRSQTFSATGAGIADASINQDQYGNNNGIRIRCVYTATATTQQFVITPTGIGTLHLYALSNRKVITQSATVNLNGSAMDADNHPLTTTWSVVSKNPLTAPDPTFANASQVVTTATFTESGTYVLRLSANDGYVTSADDITITVGPPLPAKYATWAGGTFANAFTDTALTSNPDGDSMSNLMEFAFGTDPSLSREGSLAIDGSSHGSPTLIKNGGNFEFYFMRRKDHGSSGSVSYTPQFSNDLTSFTNSTDTPTWVANSASDPTHYEVVKVPFPNGTKFGRVQIVTVP